MTIDVIFEQSDMEIRPEFRSVIPVGSERMGATFFPYVSEEGVLSWTNNGDYPNPAPVYIKGADGRTPVKGMDYWTDADKTEMVADVINSLPVYDGSVVE